MASNSPKSRLSVSVLQCCKIETYSATFLVQYLWYREPYQHGSAHTTMAKASYYTITVHFTTVNPLSFGYIVTTQMSSVLVDVQVSSVELSCSSNLSLTVGTSQCLECTNAYLALLLPFALAGLMLVLLLIICNLTVSMGTIKHIWCRSIPASASSLHSMAEP